MTKSNDKPDLSKNCLVVAITVTAALVTIIVGLPTVRDSISAIFSPKTTIVLSDKFDTSNGSYDTNIWDCAHECRVENIVIKDGLLNLKRNNGGFTSLVSRSEWLYSDFLLLTGKFQIANGASYSTGWIGMSPNIGGCFVGNLDDVQSPYILCESGPALGSDSKYTTAKLPAEFDKWYQMKMQFNQNTGIITFYIDNNQIGEYALVTHSDKGQVSLGIFSNDNIFSSSQIYMDDITVTVSK